MLPIEVTMPNPIRKSNDTPPFGSAGGESVELPDFDTPNEAAMQLVEASWGEFCGRIGLKEIPDFRAILAAHRANPPQPRWRWSHWLVRPFVAFNDWFKAYH
jgi:hypothetical protein